MKFTKTVLTGLAVGLAAVKPADARLEITDVFEVVMEGPGSCREYFDTKKVLQPWWADIRTLTEQARKTMHPDAYSESHSIQKLVQAFYGVAPVDGPDNTVEPGPDLSVQRRVWHKVSDWHWKMDKFVSVKRDSKPKPFLACDSGFLEFQLPETPIQTHVKAKLGNGEHSKTFGELSAQIGVAYKSGWCWWHTLDKHYYCVPRGQPGESKDFPYPQDPENGNSHHCLGGGLAYTLFSYPEEASDSIIQKQFRPSRATVVLCPASFKTEDHALDHRWQYEGKELDEWQPGSLTFYHELFHLVIGESPQSSYQYYENPAAATPDTDKRFARVGPATIPSKSAHKWKLFEHEGYGDRVVNIMKDFPSKKLAWDSRTEFPVASATDCLYLALYDTAEPQSNNEELWLSAKTPECHAWFGYANWRQQKGGYGAPGGRRRKQDWHTGTAQPKDIPFESVFPKLAAKFVPIPIQPLPGPYRDNYNKWTEWNLKYADDLEQSTVQAGTTPDDA